MLKSYIITILWRNQTGRATPEKMTYQRTNYCAAEAVRSVLAEGALDSDQVNGQPLYEIKVREA